MTYASISIDRRERYYRDVATHIAADPLGFYCRAEAGRRIQGNVKPKDYATPKPKPAARPANVYALRPKHEAEESERNRAQAQALSRQTPAGGKE